MSLTSASKPGSKSSAEGESEDPLLASSQGHSIGPSIATSSILPDQDVETVDRMIVDAEASYNKWHHPDPYVVPWAPGGSKFHQNLTPPSGIEIIFDYGREDQD